MGPCNCVTYNVLQPDLVETVERQALDTRGGDLWLSRRRCRFDLRQSRLRGGGRETGDQSGHRQNTNDSKLHDEGIDRESLEMGDWGDEVKEEGRNDYALEDFNLYGGVTTLEPWSRKA